MDMTSKIPTITELKTADDTSKWLLLWQGLTDTWTKLMDLHEHVQNEVDVDVAKHEQILITGSNDKSSLIEQVRKNTNFIDGIKKVIWIVAAAVLAQTVAFAYAVTVAYFKFLPVLERLANSQP